MTADAPASTLMTTEELLALPDDGKDRELIRGELRERERTRRNQWHSSVEANLAHLLLTWLRQTPGRGGKVVSGEAGFRLRRDPDSTVGIDVAYVSPEVVGRTPASFPYFEGPPVLAVEILSPSDLQQDIDEKIGEYRAAGVPLIWIVSPVHQTVLVFRAGAKPALFNVGDELSGEPELPGFRVAVAEVFRP